MSVFFGLVIGACLLSSLVMAGLSIVELLRSVPGTTMPTSAGVRTRSA